jgi:hypothetical protein
MAPIIAGAKILLAKAAAHSKATTKANIEKITNSSMGLRLDFDFDGISILI